MTSTISHKREPNAPVQKEDNLKKSKTSPSSMIFAKIRPTWLENIGKSACVILNQNAFSKLFPGEDEEAPHYIRIANRVYLVAVRSLEPDSPTIALNLSQQDELTNYMNVCANKEEEIQIERFDPQVKPPPLQRIEFQLEIFNESFSASSFPIQVDATKLQELVKELLSERFLAEGQRCLIPYRRGTLSLEVSKMFSEDSFAELTKETRTDFQVKENDKIALVEKVSSADILNLDIEIRAVKTDFLWNPKETPLPIVMSKEEAKKILIEELNGNSLSQGQIIQARYDASWRYSFCLKNVHLKKNSPLTHHPVYQIDENTPITLRGTSNVVLTKDLPPIQAKKAKWIVRNIEKPSAQDNRFDYICVKELEQSIRKVIHQRSITSRERIRVQLSTCLAEVELSNAAGANKEEFLNQKWTFDENSELELALTQDLGVTLVESANIYPIKKLKLHVEQDFQLDEMQIFQMMMGGDDPRKTVFLKQETLERMIKENHLHHIKKEQAFNLTHTQGELLRVRVDGWKLEDESLKKSKYHRLGQITPNTKFKFKTEWVSLLQEKMTLNHSNVEERLREMGIGGLAKELHVIVRSILSSRGPAQALRKELGLNPPRGLLLYGPPGTGKTALTRKLGKVFGCKGKQFQLISGSQIHSKFIGDSEKNLRKYFQPAIEAQERDGDESALHIIAFDEIDSFLGARGTGGSNDKYHTSVVNQMLTLMDGLKQLNNVLVIGITNHKDMIDPALLRPGRFDKQLEIGLPDENSRREIFEIYLKPFIKSNLLSDELTIHGLASWAKSYSGADIMGLVSNAAEILIDRVMKEINKTGEFPDKITTEHLQASANGKITWRDLQEAKTLLKEAKKPLTYFM